MKIAGRMVSRTFLVKHKGKTYSVNCLVSDYYSPALLNRNTWEIYDENGEELQIYFFGSEPTKEKEKILKNQKLFEELVRFCEKEIKL